MNLFLREMKSNRKSLIFWCICIVFFVFAGMTKFATLSSSGQSIDDLMATIPDAFKSLFGMQGYDLSSISGYFGVIFSYLSLIVTIHAAILGANVLTKEETDKTAEFLFAKPIARNTVVKIKIFALLVNLMIVNLCTSVSSIFSVSYYNKGESISGDIINMMMALFIMQLIFMFVGTAVAAVCKKPKIVGPISVGILMGTYIVSAIIDINDNLANLKFITPFKYFIAKNILKDSGIDPFFGVLSILIITTLVIVTFVFYKKRDLSI